MDGSRDVISGDKLLPSGRIITIRPHTRFVAFPEHSHDYVEMVYMCAGQTRHVVNGAELTLRAGELLMLGQHARQSIAPAGEGDVAVNFIVRPAFFSGTLPFLGEEETPLRRFVVGCLTGENETGYLLFHVAEILPIQNLIENLLYTLTEQIPNRRASCRAPRACSSPSCSTIPTPCSSRAGNRTPCSPSCAMWRSTTPTGALRRSPRGCTMS